MPPTVKYRREDVVDAALDVVRQRGIDAVTAREVARALHGSVGPIFTWFKTMDALKAEVCRRAMALYRSYVEAGLAESIPFLGVGRQYIRFAREEPELYRLLFLTRPGRFSGGAMAALKLSRDLARPSIMEIYRLSAAEADRYFRDLWLVVFSFATLIVTDDCPYTDDEMSAVLTEVSLAVCKAYKDIPGLPEGRFDRDACFRALVER